MVVEKRTKRTFERGSTGKMAAVPNQELAEGLASLKKSTPASEGGEAPAPRRTPTPVDANADGLTASEREKRMAVLEQARAKEAERAAKAAEDAAKRDAERKAREAAEKARQEELRQLAEAEESRRRAEQDPVRRDGLARRARAHRGHHLGSLPALASPRGERGWVVAVGGGARPWGKAGPTAR